MALRLAIAINLVILITHYGCVDIIRYINW